MDILLKMTEFVILASLRPYIRPFWVNFPALKVLIAREMTFRFFWIFLKVLVSLSIIVQKLIFYFYWKWVNFALKHGHFCDKLILVVTSYRGPNQKKAIFEVF